MFLSSIFSFFSFFVYLLYLHNVYVVYNYFIYYNTNLNQVLEASWSFDHLQKLIDFNWCSLKNEELNFDLNIPTYRNKYHISLEGGDLPFIIIFYCLNIAGMYPGLDLTQANKTRYILTDISPNKKKKKY